MDDLEAKLQSLKSETERVRRSYAQAEYQQQQIRENFKQAINRLKTDFGATSLEDAQQMLAEKEQKMQSLLSEIEQALSSGG